MSGGTPIAMKIGRLTGYFQERQMVTWKDHYVERQRRRDEIASARQHRALAELERGSRSRVAVGQSLTAFFGTLPAKLMASLRRQAGLHGS